MAPKKTWKRELSVFLFVFWAWIVYSDNLEMVEAITAPVFLFGAAAFGMDWSSKQTTLVSKKVKEEE